MEAQDKQFTANLLIIDARLEESCNKFDFIATYEFRKDLFDGETLEQIPESDKKVITSTANR